MKDYVMNILVIGKAAPISTANEILEQSKKNPGFQIIKFTNLLLKGFVYNQQNIEILSNISNPKKFYSPSTHEEDEGIRYHYLPTINIPIISQLLHLIYSFIYTFIWCIKTKGEKIVFCDIFAYSSSLGAICTTKLLSVKCCAQVTDMIGITPVTSKYSNKNRLWNFIFKLRSYGQLSILKQYDLFVFLTKYMNDVYNPLKKPYMIMEGSVDSGFKPIQNNKIKTPRIIMYAGSIEAEYGFNELVLAFMSLNLDDLELHIYGNGKFVESLINYQKIDQRIKYLGIASNEKIVEAEQQATLLVNPRLSHQEFTKYSFPSKTSEYMLSGTPLLTTKLPGIPEEYFEYIYTFDDETIEGFAQSLHKVLSLSQIELETKGKDAQRFILKNKNNIIQTKKMIDFFSSSCTMI